MTNSVCSLFFLKKFPVLARALLKYVWNKSYANTKCGRFCWAEEQMFLEVTYAGWIPMLQNLQNLMSPNLQLDC